MNNELIEVKKVGYDLDGVCRNFEKAFNDAFERRYPDMMDRVGPPTIYSCEERYNLSELGLGGWEFITEVAPKELFGLAEIIPGVYESLVAATEWAAKAGIELVVVSHQAPKVQHFSWFWLYSNHIPISNVVFVQDAADKWKYVDVMIDDSPHVLETKPEGKVSIKVNLPYNGEAKSDYAINHIREALPILKDLVG